MLPQAVTPRASAVGEAETVSSAKALTLTRLLIVENCMAFARNRRFDWELGCEER